MTLKEHAAVKALVAKGVRQDHAVQRVVSARRKTHDFYIKIGKRG